MTAKPAHSNFVASAISSLISEFYMHAGNDKVRMAMCELIETAYINGRISRADFHEMMRAIQ